MTFVFLGCGVFSLIILQFHFKESDYSRKIATTDYSMSKLARNRIGKISTAHPETKSIHDNKLKDELMQTALSLEPGLALDQTIRKILLEKGALKSLEFFKTLPAGNIRTISIGLALFDLSRTDREGALRAAFELSPDDLHELTIPNLFLPTGAPDLLKSMSSIFKLPRGDLRDRSFAILVQSGEYIDSESIRELMNEESLSAKEREILSSCYAKSLIRDDAIGASKSIEMLKNDAKFPLVYDLMLHWPENSLEEAVSWLYRNNVPPRMMDTALRSIISKSLQEGEASAIRLVESLPPGRASDATYAQLTDMLYEKNEISAKNWIDSLPNGRPKEIAIEAYCMRSFDQDPQKCLDNIFQFQNEEGSNLRLRDKIVSEWATQNPEGAFLWLNESNDLDDIVRADLRQKILLGWASSSPVEMMQRIEKDPSFIVNKEVGGQIVDAMSADGSYAEAANSMMKMGWESPNRVSFLAGRWLIEDPISASQWLSALPKGELFDSGAMAVVLAMANDDPPGAKKWANSISDKGLRMEASDILKK